MSGENGSAAASGDQQERSRRTVPGIALSEEQLSPEELSQLLHELKVYQVELEIQNEELRQTKLELEDSQAQYIELYEHAPLAYITLDEHGLFEKVNMTFAEMIGTTRETLLNQSFSHYILPEDQDIFYLKRRQRLPAGETESWDMRMLRADGSVYWAHLVMYCMLHGACRITLTDITGRKTSETIMAASLKLSEYAVSHSFDELLTQVVDEVEAITASTVGFFHFLESDQVTLTLQAWSTNTLNTICTAEGKGEHYPVDKAGVWVECVRTGKPVIHNSYATLPGRKGLPQGHAPIERELVVPIFRGNLIVAIVGVGNKPTEYDDRDVDIVSTLINFTWDIVNNKLKEVALEEANVALEKRVMERTSALEQAHEQMKKVSFELVWAEEKERERIAAELHDRVGQSLLLAKMKLDALLETVATAVCRDAVEAAATLLESSIHDIRSLTFRMRPPILDTAGIETTLEWLCSSISDDYDLKVDFNSDGRHRNLSAEVRYSLYQAVRELLLNVAKHAQTTTAQLRVKSAGSNFEIEIIDNGVGFNRTGSSLKHMRNGGYGLYNVQQRIERLDGSMAIESAPGKGTKVTITVPLTAAGEQGAIHEN